MVHPRSACRPRPIPVTILAGFVLLAVGPAARGDGPARPPARLMPAEGLSAYLEYDGLDDHAAAWKATAAHAMLRGTQAGATVADVIRQVVDRALKEMPGAELSGTDVVAFHDHLLGHGFALGLYDEGGDLDSSVIVVRGLGRGGARAQFDRALRLALGKEAAAALKPTTIRGRAIYQLKHESKLALGVGPAIQFGGPVSIPAPAPLPRVEEPPAPAPPPRPEASPAPRRAEPVVIAPVPLHEMPPELMARMPGEIPPSVDSWWFEGDDLILVSVQSGPERAPKADAAKKGGPAPRQDRLAVVLDAIEGKRPDATTHPGRVAALAEGREIAGFEPDGLFFIETGSSGVGILEALRADARFPALAGLPLPVPIPGIVPGPGGIDPAKALGLDGIKRIVGRWGFHGKGLLTDIRVEAPSPRKGIVGLLDGPSFRKDRLPAMPRGAGSIVVGSLDPAGKIDAMIGLAKSAQPDAAKDIDAALQAGERAVRDATGVRVREDLLGRLRPSWCVYAAPGGWDGKNPGEAAPVVLLGVDDADAFGKTLDTLATRGNAALRGLEGLVANPAEPPTVALERLPAPERGYRLTSPSGMVPWLDGTVEPTIALGKSSVVLAANPAQARAAVAAESGSGPRWAPTGELARAIECLPAELTFLWIGNPSDSSWPETLATFPKLVQYLGNFIDLAVQGGGDGTSEVRALLGIPRPGGFRLRIDRSKLAEARDLRALLFPSVVAASVDDRGLRILAREAVPFGCFGTDAGFKINLSAARGWPDNLKFSLRYKPGE